MVSSDKRKHVREIIDKYGVDFIGIQETQLEELENFDVAN
jgi:hypothetical protein